ncbi:hypothetical protein PORY_000882 [Pneumocystis oryctolagi]|uniref:Uncharacterized protein n=1 Tax=Pneumocystis oryctolagi TaxID=42067 RepID=A0ACB7CDX5_9ASCO|nr:hypothetical protein PORY_000882 [Pneumocystis oryctolagi]
MSEKTVPLKIYDGTNDAVLFKQIVVVNNVPSIFLIKNGLVRKSLYGDVTADNLLESIKIISEEKPLLDTSRQNENDSHIDMDTHSTLTDIDSLTTCKKETARYLQHEKTKSIEQRKKYIDTLKDVRLWIDENRTDNNAPYNLIQAYPKRKFDVLEETVSLEMLNLCPSATLILTPLKNVASAYVETSKGYFSRLFGVFNYFAKSIYSTFSWAFMFIGRNNFVKNVEQNKKAVSSDNQRISTFQNKNKDKNVWYNGNMLNQEPPKEKNN